MPTSPRISAFAAVLACALLMTGCVGDTSDPEPSPEPTVTSTSTPVFASEEEALAAATEAYEAYLSISDKITSEGGTQPERIEPFVTEAYFEIEAEGFREFRDMGNATRGDSAVDSVRVQQFPGKSNAAVSLTVYLCTDITSVRLVDAAGNDVTPVDRPDRVPLQIDFDVIASNPATLLIDRSEVWSGENFC